VTSWTDDISHRELIRDGSDASLTVDPSHLRFVFQGMQEEDKSGLGYGEFEWRIGMLSPRSYLRIVRAMVQPGPASS